MTESNTRERDLVLSPNEFAYISDLTKGLISVYVGPYKTSLAGTDQPVVFDEATKRFTRCDLAQAIQIFATAPEGWYVILKNPAKDGDRPKTGTSNSLKDLDVGHKVNIPGPVSFSLWPGQMVQVVQGHHLRSNQYLLVRIYDEDAARKNWSQTVAKSQSGEGSALVEAPPLIIGQQLLIKGTDASFYIPPTGVAVLADEQGNYVRDAVTLERLEYCILLDEDGNKRFIQGPAVVIPEPTEAFVTHNETRKFKAIELSDISGIYIKVIASYEENGKAYKVGDELFITGADQMIYYPRPEHAIIKYGDQGDRHYAVAIPAGEGRYCLDRTTGQVRLVKGPCMFLPDPRKEVIVRRVLDERQVQLWYPGNSEALVHNQTLAEEVGSHGMDMMAFAAAAPMDQERSLIRRKSSEKLSENFAGDRFNRGQSFSKPRTITLDTKYEGAVGISIWNGYAIQITSKSGARHVEVGPKAVLLEYDETLEPVELSTGKPKTADKLLRTTFLRTAHNFVSDIVDAETSDLCPVRIKVSYRLNFEGDPSLWFGVENYVKYLCDHMRSMLRNAVKQVGIEQFYANSIDMVRDTVLGEHPEEVEGGLAAKRTGRFFPENGMRVYDVEVLDVTISDPTIAKQLTGTQHALVSKALELVSARRQAEYLKESEVISRDVTATKAETKRLELELQTEVVKRELSVSLEKIAAKAAERDGNERLRLADDALMTKLAESDLARQKQDAVFRDEEAGIELERRIAELKADVDALVAKAQAVSPNLVAALQAFSDRALLEKMATSMAPLSILGGGSVSEIFANMLKDTALEKLVSGKPTREE